MDAVDKKLLKRILSPLNKKARASISVKNVNVALDYLSELVDSEEHMQLVTSVLREFERRGIERPKELAQVLGLSRALFESRRISLAEHLFFVSAEFERVTESRLESEGHVKNLLNQSAKIRKKYGLKEDEYWLRKEEPKEMVKINEEFEVIRSTIFEQELRKHHFAKLANIYCSDPRKFNQLRERGRRAMFHKDEVTDALRDFISSCEENARLAASVDAYFAAIVSLGAAGEGRLIERCLRSKTKASAVAEKLAKKCRPYKPDDPMEWKFITLVEVCANAKWFCPVKVKQGTFDSQGVADGLRKQRNLIHPGRQLKERAWIGIEERDYDDAMAFYAILVSSLSTRVEKPSAAKGDRLKR